MDFHADEYDKFEQVCSAMNGTIIVTTSQLRASVIRCWQVGTSCARIDASFARSYRSTRCESRNSFVQRGSIDGQLFRAHVFVTRV